MLNFFQRKKTIYGTGRWAYAYEKHKVLSRKNTGVCIDGKRSLSSEKSNHHSVFFGKSGVGKSMILVNTILNRTNSAESGSMVITDPSAEQYLMTAPYLRSIGYTVRCFNLMDLEPFSRLSEDDYSYAYHTYPELLQTSSSFNPLHRVHTIDEIEEVGEMFVEAKYSDASGSDQFWNTGATKIINLFITALASEKNNPSYQFHLPKTPSSILYLIEQYAANITELRQRMEDLLNARAYMSFESFMGQEKKIISGMLSTAETVMRDFVKEKIHNVTETDTLQFEDLRTKPTAIFITVSSGQVRTYEFILSLLYTQIFNYCEKTQGGKQVYFLLDETANCGKIKDFAIKASTLRKFNVSITIIVQYLKQLRRLYGTNDTEEILENISSKLFFSGLGLEASEYVSKVLGDQTTSKSEQSFTKEGETAATRSVETGRRLLTADEVRCLPKNKAIFIHDNVRPMKLTTSPLYNHKKNKRKVGVARGLEIIKRIREPEKKSIDKRNKNSNILRFINTIPLIRAIKSTKT